MLTGTPVAKYTTSLEQSVSTLAAGSTDQEASNRVPQQDVETAIEQSKGHLQKPYQIMVKCGFLTEARES